MNKIIWMLNHHAALPEHSTGTRHYDFGKELVKRGYTVYIFASSYIHNKYINILNPNEKIRKELVDGIHWIWINTRAYRGNGRNRILGMLDYYRAMMRIYRSFPNPDVIIGSSVHPLACIAGIHIAKRTRAKSVSEIRDLWPETLVEMGSLKKSNPLTKILYALENYIYKKSDEIIITAPGMKNYIVNKGFQDKKITYINNGIDIKTFDLQAKDITKNNKEISFDKNLFHVIYVGAHGIANDLNTLIEAANKLKNKIHILFTLVGDGANKDNLVNKVKEYQLKNFRFFEPIPKYQISSLLLHADCLIFSLVDAPVFQYGISPNKLRDYLCAEKPIISSVHTINDPVAESGAGICIDPENPTQMAKAILQLYEMNEKDREELGLRGRRYVEQNFDMPILVDRLEEVLHS